MAQRLLCRPQRRASLLAGALLVVLGASACSRAHAQSPANVPPLLDVAPADLNGDGANDLLIATRGVDVALNPGNDSSPATWARKNFHSNVLFDDVAVADLDGDGALDIVASSFSANLVQWWLTGADMTARASSYIALGTVTGPADAVKCDATPTSDDHVVVSSVSLADIDGDGQVELALSTFGDTVVKPSEVAVYTYSKGSGCFRKVRSRTGLGAMATHFVDVNADGRTDLVVSLQALQAVGNDKAQWGEWFELPLGGHDLVPQPLLVPFSGAQANHNLSVVDFDVLPPEPATGGSSAKPAWFALAITTHQSPFPDRHAANRGGNVSVVTPEGTELWSSAEWEKSQEEDVGGKFIMPMSPRFTPERGLIASFLRGHQAGSECPYFRGPCPGPVLQVASLEAPNPQMLSGEHFGTGVAAFFAANEPRKLRWIVFADHLRGLGVIER